jgi:hypothetical protein
MVCQLGVLKGAPQLWSGQTEAFPRSVSYHLASSPAEHTCNAISTKHKLGPEVALKISWAVTKLTCPLCRCSRRKSSRGSRQSLFRNKTEDRCLLRNCTPFPIDEDRFGRGINAVNGSKSSSSTYGLSCLPI